MDVYSLYLHVPFCNHRCSYCDFNTFAGQDRWIPEYVDALCSEISQVSSAAPEKLRVHTVFFGGGTPSLLSSDHFEKILKSVKISFQLQAECEITIEANPGTLNQDYLVRISNLGINRLSIGMQSAHPDDLRLLERQHDFLDVAEAVLWARQAGFKNISLDLIFGLPGQTLKRWKQTLEYALGLSPEHISLYALTIEHGTPLHRQWGRGFIPLVDEDLAADMYEFAMQRLDRSGFTQYEISNWATPHPPEGLFACLHNLQYWRGKPYLGLGAGAHGFASGVRTMNVGQIRAYINRCKNPTADPFPNGPATRRSISVDHHTQMQEWMMVGLRLTQEGVSVKNFQDRFGEEMEIIFGREILKLLQSGLLEWIGDDDRRLRLTQRGKLLGNQAFMQFVG